MNDPKKLHTAFVQVLALGTRRQGKLLHLAAAEPGLIDAAAAGTPRGVSSLWRTVRGERTTVDGIRRLNKLAHLHGLKKGPDTSPAGFKPAEKTKGF